MTYNTAQPHTAAYVLLEKDGKIAFVLRTGTEWMNGFYGLPSGKVEEGERFSVAAIREAKEEAGVTIRPQDLSHILTMQRKHAKEDTDNNPYWVDVIFKVAGWQGEAFNAEPHKHGELAWVDPKNLPENTIPYVKRIVASIQNGEVYTEYGWEKDNE